MSTTPDGTRVVNPNITLVSRSRLVYITLSKQDLNALKLRPSLCVSAPTTFLTISPATIKDLFNNMVVPVSLAVISFTTDTTNVHLLSFGLNLTSNTLTLVFSEAVNVATVNIDAMVLTNSFLVEDLRQQSRRLRTTSGLAVLYPSQVDVDHSHVITPNSDVVVVLLGTEDVNALQKAETLAISAASTTLVFDSSIITDMSGNPTVPWTQFVASSAMFFVEDRTVPEVREAFLYFDNTTLVLLWSETVRYSTFDVSVVNIYDPKTALPYPDGESHVTLNPLSSSVVDTANSAKISIRLTGVDINTLKLMHTQTNNDLDCLFLPSCRSSPLIYYLSKYSGFVSHPSVRDMNGNSAPVTAPAAISPIAGDTVGPVLLAFTINLITNEMAFTFDEVMSTRPFDIDWSAITFCGNAECSGDTYNFQYGDGSFVFVPGTYRAVMLITLPLQDLFNILHNLTFMKSQADTFVTLNQGGPSFMRDCSYNPNQAIAPPHALQARIFTSWNSTVFRFKYQSYNVSDLLSVATIKLVRAYAIYSSPVDVVVQIVNGSGALGATAPSYFVADTKTVHFAEGQTEASFTVSITAGARVQLGVRKGVHDDRWATMKIVAVHPLYSTASIDPAHSSAPLNIWAQCDSVTNNCLFNWNFVANTIAYDRIDLKLNPNYFIEEELSNP
jgi:hypothetical protein